MERVARFLISFTLLNGSHVFSTAGKCFTLSDAMKALLPEFFPDKRLANDLLPTPTESDDGQSTSSGEAGNMRSAEETGETVSNRSDSLSLLDSAEIKLIRIQGIEPKPEIPFAWVVNNLMNPEYFIHISVYVKIQVPIAG